jgi:glycosyltransferase involved in cell wall biosynthesis
MSVVLNVRNEARHLADCLASVKGADDLVVADMESTDDTVAIAEAAGARIVRLPNAGYCEPGRQPAIDAAAEEWVLLVDADERLSEGGIEKLRVMAASARPDVSAYLLPEPTYLGSRLIHATGWGAAHERHPRFFRRSHVTWPARIHAVPHFEAAVVDLPDGVDVTLKNLKFDSLEHAISKFNHYTSVEADERRAAAVTSTPSEAIEDAVAEFTRRYSPDEDGSLSLALSVGFFMYRFLTHVKTIERSGWPAAGVPGQESMRRAWEAFLETLATGERERVRAARRYRRKWTVRSTRRRSVTGMGQPPRLLASTRARTPRWRG